MPHEIDTTNYAIEARFTQGQGVLESDLEHIGEAALSNLVHTLATLLADGDDYVRPGVLFGCAPSVAGATTVTLTKGAVLSAQPPANAGVFTYGPVAPLVWQTTTTFGMAAMPGSFPRVDALILTRDLVEDTTDSRVIVNTTGPTYTPTNVPHRRLWRAARAWLTGTDGAYTPPTITPDTAVLIGYLVREDAVTASFVDMRRHLSLKQDKASVPQHISRQGWVTPDSTRCAVTAGTGLNLAVAGGRVVLDGQAVPVKPAVVTLTSDPAAEVWNHVVVSSVNDFGEGIVSVVAQTPGDTYDPPAANDAILASAFVEVAGTAPLLLLDQRKLSKWMRATHFAPGERVTPENVRTVQWVLDPDTGVASDGTDGVLLSGRLQYADGMPYLPGVDGTLYVRAQVWARAAAVAANDGVDAYTVVKYNQPSWAIGIGVTAVLSAYQEPVAVYAYTATDNRMLIHLRVFNGAPNPLFVDGAFLTLTFERLSTDGLFEAGSGMSPNEYQAAVEAARAGTGNMGYIVSSQTVTIPYPF